MALKALIFGTKEATEKFKPFYELAVKRGDFEIVAQAIFDPETNRYIHNGKHGGGGIIMSLTLQ